MWKNVFLLCKCPMKKEITQKTMWFLRPQPIAIQPRRYSSINFMTSLPKALEHDVIFVLIIRFDINENFVFIKYEDGAKKQLNSSIIIGFSKKGTKRT